MIPEINWWQVSVVTTLFFEYNEYLGVFWRVCVEFYNWVTHTIVVAAGQPTPRSSCRSAWFITRPQSEYDQLYSVRDPGFTIRRLYLRPLRQLWLCWSYKWRGTHWHRVTVPGRSLSPSCGASFSPWCSCWGTWSWSRWGQPASSPTSHHDAYPGSRPWADHCCSWCLHRVLGGP